MLAVLLTSGLEAQMKRRKGSGYGSKQKTRFTQLDGSGALEKWEKSLIITKGNSIISRWGSSTGQEVSMLVKVTEVPRCGMTYRRKTNYFSLLNTPILHAPTSKCKVDSVVILGTDVTVEACSSIEVGVRNRHAWFEHQRPH